MYMMTHAFFYQLFTNFRNDPGSHCTRSAFPLLEKHGQDQDIGRGCLLQVPSAIVNAREGRVKIRRNLTGIQ